MRWAKIAATVHGRAEDAEEAGAESVYGEPDEIDPTEVVRDPREDDDDPGAGPSLAADR